MRRMWAAGAAIAVCLVLAGGGTAAQSPSAPAPAGGLESADWLLLSVNGHPVMDPVTSNIIFMTGEAGGFAGCNRYVASYDTDGVSTLRFGPIAKTRYPCETMYGDAAVAAYLAALGTVASYAVSGTELDMADANGWVVLRYSLAVPATATVEVQGP